MSQISVKINIVKLGTVKTMKFQGDMTIQEVCKDIREKLGEETAGGTDHGLFWPDQGKWLEPKRTLDFYDLKSGDLLEYKKKHRPLRVKMMDDTIKTILVDDSFTVHQLVQTVCSRIGITNPDEYSFTTDSLSATKAAPAKEAKGKIAHPGGDQWLNPDKSLREQGIDENEVLLLKKKFFFSDQNVDRNDPIQLNLLYVQAQEAIVKGTHPCTMEEAAQFAALQCQVQFGNHEPDKHKPGFLPVDLFLPPEYAKKRVELEKKIFQEHRKLQGMSELNAKFRYVQLCRSLKTYGVTFFDVKEKVPKKNKMVAILLGVTRDSVMRVDAETKEVLKVWPLTTLRRWAASPNSFTLDFGDYEEAYYSIQTSEGDAISQLISGYIDIILKKKKDADRILAEEDAELAITEDMVAAGQATAITVVPGKAGQAMEVNVAQAGSVHGSDPNMSGMRHGQMQSAQYSNVMSMSPGMQFAQRSGTSDFSGASAAQQGVLQNINSGFAAVNAAQSDLNIATTLPPLGNDPASVQWRKQTMDINKQNVASQVAAHLAATASVVNLTAVDPEQMNYGAISSNISTMTTNLTQLASGAKMVAALMDNQADADRLLEAARALAGATQKMLTATQPAIMGQGNRQDLLASAQAIGASSSEMLKYMGDPDVSLASQQELIELAKQVTLAMTEAVGVAKGVATKCSDPKSQMDVIGATKASAASAAQLLTTTHVVAPTINSPLCQEQLIQSASQVEGAVGALTSKAKIGCPDKDAVNDLNNAADKVRAALQRLVDKARMGGQDDTDLTEVDRQAELVLAATQALLDNMGDAASLIAGAKNLAVTSTSLVNALKQQAAIETDPNEKNRLLAAARALADATTKMVNAAKDAARNPNDPLLQARLRAAAEAVEAAARAALGADNKRKAFKKLLTAAKANAAASTQLISSAKAASPSNRNQASQMQLINASKGVGENAGALVGAVRAFQENPEDPTSQLRLMTASKAALAPGATLIAAAKAAAPTVGDQASQAQLLNFAKATNDSLKKLRDAVEAAEAVSGSLELDSALETVDQTRKDLASAKVKAAQGQLRPTADQTAEGCQLEVGATAKTIGSSMAQLISAASQGNQNYSGVAARDTAAALSSLATAVKGVAATSSDRELQDQVLDTAVDVMRQSEALIGAAKDCLADPESASNQQRLLAMAQEVNKSMAQLVDSLPGQRDVARAIAHMQSTLARMSTRVPKDPSETYMSAQNKLSTAAAALTVASNALVSSARGTPAQLKEAADNLDLAFSNLVGAAQSLSSQSTDPQVQADLVAYMNDVFSSMTRLLQASKAYNADPNGPNLKNLMQLAAKGVADAVAKLMSICTTAAPGQKECSTALHSLDASQNKLDNVNNPDADNEDSYFQSLRKLADAQAALTQGLAAVPASARTQNPADIGNSALRIADAVSALTDANARAAYLIGVSDPNSVAAVPGLIDQSKVAQAVHDIAEAVEKLRDPNNKQQAIMAAASAIAKNTSALCNLCKAAATKTPNPVAKNQFIASAKTVAGTTAALVTAIKALATNPADAGAREACSTNAQPLLDAINNLKTFADSPEFAPTQAYISPMAASQQQPLIKANRDAIESSRAAVATARSLCANPADSDSVMLFNSQAKAVGDAVKQLLNAAKNAAPGQRECDDAIERVQAAIGEIDSAAVKATMGELRAPAAGPDFVSLKEALLNNAYAVASAADIVSKASKGDGNLGQAAGVIADNYTPLSSAAIDGAARATDKKTSMAMLDTSKALGEAVAELLYTAKHAGGAHDASSASLEQADAAHAKVREAVAALVTAVEGSSSHDSEVNAVINNLTSVMASVDDLADAPSGGTYQQHAEDVLQMSRDLAQLVGDLVKTRQADEAVALVPVVGERYGRLVRSAKGAAATAGEEEIKQNVLDSVRALGGAQVRLLDSVKQSLGNPSDPAARSKVTGSSRDVSSSVAAVVTAVKAGQKGVQACEESINAINDVISELDTAIVFASAGTLDPTDPTDTFSKHTDTILAGTKALTENVKALVGAVTGTQNQLAQAASNSYTTIAALKDAMRDAAAAVTSADRAAQDQVLTTTKNLATLLQDHIRASMKATSRRPEDVAQLKESAKAIITAINETLRVVRTVGDDATRAIRAIDSTIEGIKAALEQLSSEEPAQGTALPNEVVKTAQQVAASAASLVTAGTNQDDVINSTGVARKNIEDLMRTGKAATANAPTEKRLGMTDACAHTGNTMIALLNAMKLLQTGNTPNNKQEVQKAAKIVAEAVNKVVEAANQLVPTGYVDPNDPNVIAERELLAAANSIEAAARKLAAMKPPERPREADEDLPFEAQILEAAKAIAAATAALVRSATVAQREIVAAGKSGPEEDKMYFSDGTWSDGLVSAAKSVAGATGELCDAANEAVQGKAEREKVIAAAKGVSSSTAQLLSAATVKVDPKSDSTSRLRAAGSSVTRATKTLITAAEKTAAFEEEPTVSEMWSKDLNSVQAKRVQIQAYEDMLKAERMLEEARKKYKQINEKGYKEAAQRK